MIAMKRRDEKKYYMMLICILSIIYLTVVLGFATLSYRIISLDTQKELGKQAMVLAIDIAERLEMDSSEYERLLSLEFDELLKDPANIDFEKKARGVMKYTDIKYIYLQAQLDDTQVKYRVEPDETGIYSVTAGTPLNVVYLLDAVVNDKSRLGEDGGKAYSDKNRYTVLTEKDQAVFESQFPTSFISSDEWGTYITGFAPYYDNDGNFVGLIGVDLFLDKYLAHLRKNLLIISGFVITLLAIGVFAIYLTVRVKRIEDLVQEKTILSDIDGLTSVMNRRHFLELMEDRWSRCKQEKKPIALLIVDVDYFKEYNDNYGHLAGDEVLRRIAQVLKQNVRQNYDYVGRYGGDEFVVLLNNTDLSTGQAVADCLAEKINELQIEHRYSPISSHETVTVGLAAMVPEAETALEELFKRADSALYFGKEQGKNQVQAWNDSIPDKSHLPLSDWV